MTMQLAGSPALASQVPVASAPCPLPLTTIAEMQESIVKYVSTHPGTSFIEIMRVCGEAGKGDQVMCFENNPNLILWSGMSSDLIAALRTLLEEKKIHMASSSAFVYLIDGGGLKLPIAKRTMKYRTLHWLPVEFSDPNAESWGNKKIS